MTDLLAVFTQPVILSRTVHLLLLLPLCLAISIVYKTTKCETVREIPVAVLGSWLTIVISMYALGAGLLLLYEWAA